jgi:hypothetical protein
VPILWIKPFALLDLVERLGHLIRADLRRISAEHGLQSVHLQALIYLQRATDTATLRRPSPNI